MSLPEANKIRELAKSGKLSAVSREWMRCVGPEYTYQFQWLGLPIIQYPTDILAVQEAIWKIRPDFIVETGIARGGSVMLSASLMALLDLEDLGAKSSLQSSRRMVFAIDIDIRDHALLAINKSFLKNWITLLENDSTNSVNVSQINNGTFKGARGLVILDSNHTHDHVLSELRLFSQFVSIGSYMIVLDTEIEFIPSEFFSNRPWGPGNSPHTAVKQFLSESDQFVIDSEFSTKLGITTAPDGFLRRVK